MARKSSRAELGERFHLMDVLVKSHAGAARVAAAIDGMLALRQQHGFTADDIETIRLGIPRVIAGRLTNAHPVDLQAAPTAACSSSRTAPRSTSTTRSRRRKLSIFVPAPKGSAFRPFTAQEHEARFTRELSKRVSEKVCADIIGVAKDLDRLNPRWLGSVLSEG